VAKRKGVSEILKIHAKAQFSSLETVVPSHKYDPAVRTLFVDSPAGHLKIKFAKQVGVTHYRNKYLNKFDEVVDDRDYFQIYEDIMKDKTFKKYVTYTANIRTRLKGKICNLLNFS
jgi:hypothetical protein